MRGIVDLERMATAPYAEEVHDLLLKWRPGQDEPDSLARYAGYQHGLQTRSAVVSNEKGKTETDVSSNVAWKPITAKFTSAISQEQPISKLYDELSKSVYIIVAAPSIADMRAVRNEAQGSAVAVDFRTLITNCHIVDGRPMV